MKSKNTKILLLTFVFALFAHPLYLTAWNETGHQVTAAIAWENMTETTRQKVTEIMLQAPEDSDLLTFFDENDELGAKKYFMSAAYWPDVVRDRDKRDRWQKYHMGTWHYIGTYWKQTDNGPVETTGLLEDENVVERLEYFRTTLPDPDVPASEKAVQIAWVLHLVGDIHMPLHNTSRVTEETPDGDRGGNSFDLGEGWPWNLHAFWDSIIDIAEPKADSVDSFDYYISKANDISKLHPRSDFEERAQVKIQDAEAWNREGRDITMQSVYLPYLKQGEKPPARYTDNAYNIARQRLALSGYRMAEYLNQIFDPS